MSSTTTCSKFLELKLYPDRQPYSRNKARKLSSKVVITVSVALSLLALHKNNKSFLVCSGKNVIYSTSEKHSENKHTGKLSFCTGLHSRALHIKLKSVARASHSLHTLTTTQFKQGVTLFRYIVIMPPAHARRRDTSAPTPR